MRSLKFRIWTGIVEATFRASIEEVANLNRIHFSESTHNQSSSFDTDDPKLSCISRENFLSVGSKRKFSQDSKYLRAQTIVCVFTPNTLAQKTNEQVQSPTSRHTTMMILQSRSLPQPKRRMLERVAL